MNQRIKELREKQAAATAAALKYRERYEGKVGQMSAEEEQAWDAALAEADALEDEIRKLERGEDRARRTESLAESKGIVPLNESSPDAEREVKAQAFRAFLKSGRVPPELKALSSGDDDAGGFLVLPQQMADLLIAFVNDEVFVRSLATTVTVPSAQSLGVPTLDEDFEDADWTSELATGSEDTTEPFGKRELQPHPLAKRIKLSNKLIRQVTDVENLVLSRLAYRFGVTEEKAFLTGSGTGEPLGVFTPSPGGISTARDTSTINASALTGDDWINLKHDLKAAYWPRARIILNRSVLKVTRKLKDLNDNYIWATGLSPGAGLQGNPPTICEIPYLVSEFAPGTDTIDTGDYIAIIGDFSKYWIADALDMQVQRLDQLYAESNQIGFIGRKETDGMPVAEDAFRRLIVS